MSRVLSEREIWTAANQVIQRHGDTADFEAALKADHFLEEGDLDGHRTWMRILKAIKDLRVIASTDSLN